MRILVLLPESPFPWASKASRYYGPLLKALDRMRHEITAFCVRHRGLGPDEPTGYFDGTHINFTFFDPPYGQMARRERRTQWRADWALAASAFGRQARDRAVRHADIVFAEHPSTARAVETLPAAVCSLHCLRHVDLRAATSVAERWSRFLVRRAERTTLARIGRVRVTTRRLADLTRALTPGVRLSVVPLFLDPDLYDPLQPPGVPTVGFIGSMFWEPSQAAAERFLHRIVPLISSEVPGARFLVAGWEAARHLRPLRDADGVEILENFRTPRAVFERLSVLVNAPAVGTGMKVKALEAMAYGVPVVTNEAGAEGLEWDEYAPVSRGESDEQIAGAVVALLRKGDRWREVSAEGRRCVERSFSAAAIAPRLVGELMRLVTPESRELG